MESALEGDGSEWKADAVSSSFGVVQRRKNCVRKLDWSSGAVCCCAAGRLGKFLHDGFIDGWAGSLAGD